ncbi:hypothetical protein SKAU_G00280820 [Synaphobranchus kaupii]|uniref:Uncharacterized protein n=1 Tax=Synaphobranchus kaupii TaxID=118154 RepID=A0A9Q1EX22_SYNKA|nr:hypothetical protein SKAU_G00280820 [Synaphobranchus kaupii]
MDDSIGETTGTASGSTAQDMEQFSHSTTTEDRMGRKRSASSSGVLESLADTEKQQFEEFMRLEKERDQRDADYMKREEAAIEEEKRRSDK